MGIMIGFVFVSCFPIRANEIIGLADTKPSKEKKVYFTIRYGQGGFRDDRSPIGKLGGGQLTLDIKPSTSPFAISLSAEYYTNSAEPTHPYEIADMFSCNFLYMTEPFNIERINLFTGLGFGGLRVPKSEDEPDEMEWGFLSNIEAGINIRIAWKIGIYGMYKYLYSRNDPVIYFSEHIVLFGITFNFGL